MVHVVLYLTSRMCSSIIVSSYLICLFTTNSSTKAACADSLAQYSDANTTKFSFRRNLSMMLYSMDSYLGCYVRSCTIISSPEYSLELVLPGRSNVHYSMDLSMLHWFGYHLHTLLRLSFIDTQSVKDCKSTSLTWRRMDCWRSIGRYGCQCQWLTSSSFLHISELHLWQLFRSFGWLYFQLWLTIINDEDVGVVEELWIEMPLQDVDEWHDVYYWSWVRVSLSWIDFVK